MQPDWTPADINSIVANPFYAISIAPVLAEPHPPFIGEEEWIAANVKLIEDLGPEAYLRNLLSILKGNYPTAA
ncbi:MAG TPA: hypothetical protein VLW51_03210 [Solirubrobacteraceae bacterium]|nr:hypothetical protein [Solirubrobacteraceae bacterium]